MGVYSLPTDLLPDFGGVTPTVSLPTQRRNFPAPMHRGYFTWSNARPRVQRGALPVDAKAEDIVGAASVAAVVVVCSGAGSGKTTRVPCYFIDDALTRGTSARVLCTQPRRLAAMANAKRVSDEVGQGFVGHCVRGDRKMPTNASHVVYATEGCAMKLFDNDEYTHICLDDFELRSVDMDLLLLRARIPPLSSWRFCCISQGWEVRQSPRAT